METERRIFFHTTVIRPCLEIRSCDPHNFIPATSSLTEFFKNRVEGRLLYRWTGKGPMSSEVFFPEKTSCR